MTANLVAPSGVCRDDIAGWRRLSVDGWNWRIRPDHGDGLRSHPLLSLSKRSVGTIIKQGPHRTVRRVEALDANGAYFVKIFHRSDWRARWKHWLRGEPAYWEFSRYRQALRRQVPTAEVVAIGVDAARSGQSALVTQGIDDVVPLDEWLRQRTTRVAPSQRRALAEQLGELIGQMHSRGVIHRDLHAGNLLLRCRADELHLWLVDLAPLRFLRSSPSVAEIANNLGRLRHSLLEQLSLTDQAAFFQAYWRRFTGHLAGRTPPWSGDQHSAWSDLAQRCDLVARAAWSEMDRAWARGNSKQIVITTPQVHCRGLARLGRERLERLCRLADVHESAGESIPLSTRQISSASDEQSLVIVTRRTRSASNDTETGWARHCWEIGHALERRWIAAPVPVYMLDSRPSAAREQEVAFLKETSWNSLRSVCNDANALSDIAPRVIDLLKRFHDLGFAHSALNLAEIEACQKDERRQCRFASLDFIRRLGTVSQAQRCADLQPLAAEISRLHGVSLSIKLRGLKRYLGPSEAADWKRCWGMISPSLSQPEAHRRAA